MTKALTIRNGDGDDTPFGQRSDNGLCSVFTTGQVAKMCRVAPRTVAKWFDAGKLRGYRLPGSLDRRIPRGDLLRFLREHGMPTDGLKATSARVLLLGLEPRESERLAAVLPESKGWEVIRASTPYEAGVLAADGLAAAVIDCSIGRAEVLQIAESPRCVTPRPYVAIICNEDEPDRGEL